jgi:2TM domain
MNYQLISNPEERFMVSDEEIKQTARKQSRAKLWFYINFACYLIVNISLLITWIVYYKVTDVMGLLAIVGGTLFGWGIGIVAHYISVFTGKK